jgi:hypothetical protein
MLVQYVILLIAILVTILPAGENGRYWIYFKDKKLSSINNKPELAELLINERAIKRRQLRGEGPLLDHTDLPISQNYINRLAKMGIIIHRQSRWLNAVSCYLNEVSKEALLNLPFVLKVEPVGSSKIEPVERFEEQTFHKPVSEDYGPSFNQNDMIGVPFAHGTGFHGEDVLIAVFDTGFILDHEALKHIDVIDAWDFIYDDDNVTDEEEDVPGQHNHGTQVLSTLAGYSPGYLIGPAYESQFLLAKTDHLTLETEQDEDNWVAAAEWAEGLGADMISSSVGFDYDLGYTYEDMDGNTTAATNAADLAVKKGVSVFNSAGNEGLDDWKYIIAPADGDSVITMGGVRPDGSFWGTSSRGPTYDGRIKPDLVAQAQNVYCVNPRSIDRYTTVNGTSFSCPMGAGAGAIVLAINPSLTPMALRDTLVNNASQADNPDNLMGYGIINLEKAIFKMIGEPAVTVSNFEAVPLEGKNIIQWVVEFELGNEQWKISRKTPTTPYVEIGQLEGREFGLSPKTYYFYDFKVEGGEYFTYKLSSQFVNDSTSVIDTAQIQTIEPTNISLSTNFPNPFNSVTKIIFGLGSQQKLSLKIYDITGQLVKTLIDNKLLEAKYHHIVWDGSNDLNYSVSSGTYYLRLTADGTQKMMKMLVLK